MRAGSGGVAVSLSQPELGLALKGIYEPLLEKRLATTYPSKALRKTSLKNLLDFGGGRGSSGSCGRDRSDGLEVGAVLSRRSGNSAKNGLSLERIKLAPMHLAYEGIQTHAILDLRLNPNGGERSRLDPGANLSDGDMVDLSFRLGRSRSLGLDGGNLGGDSRGLSLLNGLGLR